MPHAHVDLVRRNTVGDINFSESELQIPDKELEDMALLISKAFNEVNELLQATKGARQLQEYHPPTLTSPISIKLLR